MKKKQFILILLSIIAYGMPFNRKIDYIEVKQTSNNKIVVQEQISPKTAENTKIKIELNEPKLTNISVCSNSSVKSYMDFRAIRDKRSAQYKYIYSDNIFTKGGYLMNGEYIGVALGSYFGKIGTKYIFALSTGKTIKAVKVEEKANKDTINGCQQKYDGSVIEFVIDSTAFAKSSNGLVFSGNFNNNEQFNGYIVKIDRVD